MRDKFGRFLKGYHASKKTEFKKGVIGKENFKWKGGRRKLKIGYIVTKAYGHPKAYRNEVYEHILVAEKKLGRYLTKNERVHHINGVKDDNRSENLIVFKNHGEHMRLHLKGKKRKGKSGKWVL